MPLTDEQKQKLKKALVWAVTVLVPLILGAIGGRTTAPETVRDVPFPVEVLVERPVVEEKPAGDRAFGWVEDREQIAANLDPQKTLHFATTPAGKAVQGDEDVFLYRVVRKVNNKGPDWYPNINQGPVGCCVGAGSKHGCDVVQATAIASGASFEWKPVSAEAIYAGSRVEVGGGQLRGDGSVGVWAWKYLKDVGGLVPMEQIGTTDLTAFSPARARQWGSSGVPPEVKAVARLHPVKGAALVTSQTDVKRALMQGYPVVVCSNVGFDNPNGSVGTRDADGFIRPRGTWPHCMCFIGWRNGSRPGALCLNSWGDTAHGGPVWPGDAPRAAFWVDAAVVDQMVRQGDSFALGDVAGFPARKPAPDWFIAAPKAERFVHRSRSPLALTAKSEVPLSW